MSGKALASFFSLSCSLNLIPFRAPYLEEMTLAETAALIAKYHPLPQSFLPTLIEVTAVFFLAKQRALGRALKKYDIFAGTAWTDNSEDLMIHALIGNAATSGC